MEYRLGFILGGLLTVVIGGVLLALILKYTKTDHSVKCKYDERQQLVRGIGFKYGFFTIVLFNAAAAFFIAVEKKQHIDHTALLLAGIILGVYIYAVYCIWNEGYFSLNENPKRVVVVFALIAILNFCVGYRSYLHGLLIENGMLTVECLNIFCGITILMLLPVMAVKHICKGKEEK